MDSNWTMTVLAASLRQRASELGLSLAEAARKAGLTERRFGNYVAGTREPDLGTLIRIAMALETSPDKLLDFKVARDPDANDRELLISRILKSAQEMDTPTLRIVALQAEAVTGSKI